MACSSYTTRFSSFRFVLQRSYLLLRSCYSSSQRETTLDSSHLVCLFWWPVALTCWLSPLPASSLYKASTFFCSQALSANSCCFQTTHNLECCQRLAFLKLKYSSCAKALRLLSSRSQENESRRPCVCANSSLRQVSWENAERSFFKVFWQRVQRAESVCIYRLYCASQCQKLVRQFRKVDLRRSSQDWSGSRRGRGAGEGCLEQGGRRGLGSMFSWFMRQNGQPTKQQIQSSRYDDKAQYDSRRSWCLSLLPFPCEEDLDLRRRSRDECDDLDLSRCRCRSPPRSYRSPLPPQRSSRSQRSYRSYRLRSWHSRAKCPILWQLKHQLVPRMSPPRPPPRGPRPPRANSMWTSLPRRFLFSLSSRARWASAWESNQTKAKWMPPCLDLILT